MPLSFPPGWGKLDPVECGLWRCWSW